MKRLGVFLLPPGWDASPSQGYPQHFASTHLYTWVERGTVRVKCLAQEHNTMSPARTGTRTTRSGVEHYHHEATAPTSRKMHQMYIFLGWVRICICDVKLRINPCLSHHSGQPRSLGNKVAQWWVQITARLPSLRGLHSTEKGKFWVSVVT